MPKRGTFEGCANDGVSGRLSQLDGNWHEFESKALRKENERKEKELRRQMQKEKERKRGVEEGGVGEREGGAKRVKE